MLQHYLDLAKPWLDHYGYFALFITLFTEGFGVLAPGQTLLIAAALLTAEGQLNLTLVLLVAWIATVSGEIVGYGIGLWGGHRLFNKVGVKQTHLAKVEGFFDKYGGGVIIVARFIDILRQLNGLVAGSMEMPFWHFMFYNALGGAIWVLTWGLGASYLGHHLETILPIVERFQPYFIALGLAALAGIAWYLFKPTKTDSTTTSEPSGTPPTTQK